MGCDSKTHPSELSLLADSNRRTGASDDCGGGQGAPGLRRSRKLDRSFAGRVMDERLLAELPESVDPCGERGEFHTFVSAGPMFSGSIEVSAGEIVERDNFVYADMLPG